MTPEEHQQVKELFLAVCLRPAEERARFLEVVCPNDAIRAEVSRLLRHHKEESVQVSGDARESDAVRPPTKTPADSVQHDPAVSLEPGQWFADRFRIRDRIGRGGMGEVWRADDTLVGRDVALKFLPRAMSRNPAWMRQLRREVRVASEITNPFICRTHDLVSANGELFVSMEYIRGEDLAALLKKIGRLPAEKALAISRQLCLGLAAAHAKGVLHRDLKPANIVIDAEGNARLTDFGLATARENVLPEQIRSGTPAYMAPEQAAGIDVSPRSDLYALGLVMYEMFTGEPAFRGASVKEFESLHQSASPSRPSDRVVDIDPCVERVILACLRKDPADRPSSALAVLAALPGGEVLTELVNAGQTPPPEIVAIAGGVGGLSRRVAASLMLAFVALLAGAIAVSDRASKGVVGGDLKPTSVLAHLARARLASAGLLQRAPHEAYGFADARNALDALVRAVDQSGPDVTLASRKGDDPVFWLRRSPGVLSSTSAPALLFNAGRLSPTDPPLVEPGMCTAYFSGRGRLVGLMSVPSATPASSDGSPQPDERAILELWGIAPENARPATARLTPSVLHTVRRAWIVDSPEGTQRLETAFLGDTLVFGALVESGGESPAARDARSDIVGPRIVELARMLLPLLMLPAALWLARVHLRQGLGDTRGAFRIAGSIFATSIVIWALLAPHAANFEFELHSLAIAVVGFLAVGTVVWCFYVALEPYVRRDWPQTMISWSRLLLGQWLDPRVGRDLLIGATLGAGWAFIIHADILLAERLGVSSSPFPRDSEALTVLLGGRHAVGVFLIAALRAVYRAVLFVMVIVVLRLTVRQVWLANALGVVIIALLYVPSGSHPLVSWATIGVGAVAVAVWALTRFGMVPVVTGMFLASNLVRSPVSFRVGNEYAAIGWLATALALAVAIIGFVVSQRPAAGVRRALP